MTTTDIEVLSSESSTNEEPWCRFRGMRSVSAQPDPTIYCEWH